MDENKNDVPLPEVVSGQVVVDGKVKDPKIKKSHWPPTKKQLLVVGSVVIALVLGIGAYFMFFTTEQPKKPVVVAKKLPPKPTTIASNLTGLQVDPATNQRPVTGAMIENSLEARPQSGLDQAGVVFEAIAEGGITRFLALFQDSQPDYIGPVRSVRPYYAQWCMGFDCAIAHVGGSPEALGDIQSWGTKDLDQYVNGNSYWRINTRYSPHNVYTSTQKLNELALGKGYSAAEFTPIVRKPDAPSKTPNAASVDLNISSYNFNSHYDWDIKTNSYKRSQAGVPHMTVNATGKESQITPKTIVVMEMSYGIAFDKHSSYGVLSSGPARVFQDGTVSDVTWSKTDLKSQIVLTDASGKPFALNAGQTWFVATNTLSDAVYR